ncbi:hypothetical protein CCHL11_00734 [Colletotrichum chlorophyti]|uniref:Arb2 domain-containing protein n=1 Tax=Colletotrichum chlorophyti TaxID=708187 RepID=A0A1Q8S5B2_9PEZI|nr:hypothetical protein CCHL11_00734 [Colletotrichum chlorophyti]
MFRRRWSGLPKDPIFSSDLKGLGYFVNEQDEIRNIVEPNHYFKYYLTKNGRKGLTKVLLPLGVEPSNPNVPIFTSIDLPSASRIIVIFGEPSQDLGNVALRVINGPGGINKGSMVSVVDEALRQTSSATDTSPPGIVLANTGELWWWPEGKKPLSPTSALAVPLKSMVHHGRANDVELHSISKNVSPMAHVQYLLEILPSLISSTARLDIIGIGLGADNVTKALDDPKAWSVLGHRINTLSLLGSSTNINELSHEPFKEFLPRRARAYIIDAALALTPIAKPGGNPNTASFTQHGCTVYSSGEEYYVELMLITSRVPILAWLQEVALMGPDYRHPEVVAVDPHVPTEEEWAAASRGTAWDNIPEFAKPSVGYAMPLEDRDHREVLDRLEDFVERQNGKQGEVSD